jgi:hypothetical protein
MTTFITAFATVPTASDLSTFTQLPTVLTNLVRIYLAPDAYFCLEKNPTMNHSVSALPTNASFLRQIGPIAYFFVQGVSPSLLFMDLSKPDAANKSLKLARECNLSATNFCADPSNGYFYTLFADRMEVLGLGRDTPEEWIIDLIRWRTDQSSVVYDNKWAIHTAFVESDDVMRFTFFDYDVMSSSLLIGCKDGTAKVCSAKDPHNNMTVFNTSAIVHMASVNAHTIAIYDAANSLKFYDRESGQEVADASFFLPVRPIFSSYTIASSKGSAIVGAINATNFTLVSFPGGFWRRNSGLIHLLDCLDLTPHAFITINAKATAFCAYDTTLMLIDNGSVTLLSCEK